MRRLSSSNPKKLTRANDAVDENVARYQAIVVLVHLSEQVCEARFLVVHEFQELQKREDEKEEKSFMKMMMERRRELSLRPN